jgi:hypothetical protein
MSRGEHGHCEPIAFSVESPCKGYRSALPTSCRALRLRGRSMMPLEVPTTVVPTLKAGRWAAACDRSFYTQQ